ncbi:Fic family protein [Candidatus Protochlamydia phocaeensis]|uniref:Fic family protein n=1 Tax=Candidatus Protochlamydia phocaeensis TaxID=1414722 RepID=UPI0008385B65|nr:Fic family protein [Candidatus Protochlamydia phocaeensis]
MHSLTQFYLNQLRFSEEHLSTLRTIGEYRGKQVLYFKQAPEILKNLQQVAVIESSESSNRLEGITAPHSRIADLVIKNSSPIDRSEQEIAGYRDALNLIHQSGVHMRFSLNVILQLHSWLYRYLPHQGGQWKLTDNQILEIHPDGRKRIRFTPTTAFETPQAMEELVRRYDASIQAWGKEPLIILPLTILDFLCIHPFSDGNGRTARLLTLLLLYHFDYQVGRYISLERIFEESKDSYYQTLERSSKGWHEGEHDVMPWMTYFWGVLLRAYGEFEARVGTLKTGQGSKNAYIRQTVESMIGPFAISDIERACPAVSRDTIRLVLRQLRDESVIIPQGKGRGAKWIVNR